MPIFLPIIPEIISSRLSLQLDRYVDASWHLQPG